jgi:hypothetical protein
VEEEGRGVLDYGKVGLKLASVRAYEVTCMAFTSWYMYVMALPLRTAEWR